MKRRPWLIAARYKKLVDCSPFINSSMTRPDNLRHYPATAPSPRDPPRKHPNPQFRRSAGKAQCNLDMVSFNPRRRTRIWSVQHVHIDPTQGTRGQGLPSTSTPPS